MSPTFAVSAAQRVANALADKLFTNGVGQVADRLVLELPGGKDGGDWRREGAVRQVETHLRVEFERTAYDV